MNHIEAMKQALEALENTGPVSSDQYHKERNAMTTLRTAIEATENSVAELDVDATVAQPADNGPDYEDGPDEEGFSGPRPWNGFAQPAPEREPVAWVERWHGSGPDRGWWIWEAGLTHGNAIAYIGESDHAEQLASLIVEKHNATIATPPVAPVQKPVALEMDGKQLTLGEALDEAIAATERSASKRLNTVLVAAKNALYTTPPAAQRQWVGLTPEEIDTVYRNLPPPVQHWQLARAIEAKLKEKNT